MSTDLTTTGQLRPDGSENQLPHPLDHLSVAECDAARQAILNARGSNVAIRFRSIYLEEPPKEELSQFLELEHTGKLTAKSSRPPRLAKVQYDVVRNDKKHEYTESLVDVISGKEVHQRIVDKIHQPALML
jgi:primary-amine oxidase